jgi:hypothetical protein
MDLANLNKFIFVNNGTYRIYSTPAMEWLKAVSKPRQTTAPLKKQVVLPSLSKGRQTPKITRAKALEMMKNNKGRFFTVTFMKKDNTERTLNGIYVKDQTPSPLGYIIMKEAKLMKSGAKEQIRNINLQTLISIKIKGSTYQVK